MPSSDRSNPPSGHTAGGLTILTVLTLGCGSAEEAPNTVSDAIEVNSSARALTVPPCVGACEEPRDAEFCVNRCRSIHRAFFDAPAGPGGGPQCGTSRGKFCSEPLSTLCMCCPRNACPTFGPNNTCEVCPAGQVCNPDNWACEPACSPACGAREQCVNGSCVCNPGHTRCGGSCVDTDSNEDHCGGCFRSCALPLICDGSRCTSAGGAR